MRAAERKFTLTPVQSHVALAQGDISSLHSSSCFPVHMAPLVSALDKHAIKNAVEKSSQLISMELSPFPSYASHGLAAGMGRASPVSWLAIVAPWRNLAFSFGSSGGVWVLLYEARSQRAELSFRREEGKRDRGETSVSTRVEQPQGTRVNGDTEIPG